jgi:hypothetical protein
MLLGEILLNPLHFHADNLQAGSLEALDDLANKTSVNTVRLD